MSRKRNAPKITAAAIKAKLARVYAAPEWAIMFEVANATGHSGSRRLADAVAMSLWPSRGLELHGFEIKISRGDWQKERSQPAKAETIAAYCHRWFVVTAPGVVHDLAEVPPYWGWMEFDGNRLQTRKIALLTEAKSLDYVFLAALLRRASASDAAMIEAEIERRDAERKEAFEERVAIAADQRTYALKRLQEKVKAFQDASGIDLDANFGWHGPEEIGSAVKVLIESGITNTYNGLRRHAATLRTAAEAIERSLQSVPGIVVEEPAKGSDA